MKRTFSQRVRAAWSELAADPYRLLLLLLALVYVVIFTRLAFDMHAGMRTHRSDLGQIDQAVWNSSQGRFLEQTDNGFIATRLTDHVEPILVLISPVLWLWRDVRALLLLQAVAIAVGVLPLYHLTLRRCEALLTSTQQTQVWLREPVQQLVRPLALALGVAYLLAPQLQSALVTEFHAAPLAVPLILWAFWAVDARRWGQFLASAVLVALVKEEMALLAGGLGVWAAWRAWWDGRRAGAVPENPRAARGTKRGLAAGAVVLVFGLAWFYYATFVVVPAYAQPLYGTAESTYFQRYGALGDSSTDILRSFVTQPWAVWAIASEPARVAYLVGLLAALALLPLLGLEIVLLALPLLLANLLSAYPAQYYGEFHYSAPLVPYFSAAAAYGLARLWRPLARRADHSSAAFQHLPAAGTGTMAALAMVQNSRTALRPLLTWGLVLWILLWAGGNYWLHGRGPLGGRHDPTPITAHHQLLGRFTTQIPPDAAVTATAAVHPHVSHRRYVYQFPLGLEAPQPANWALLDVTTNTDMAPGDLKAKVDEMLAGNWGIVDAADGFLLLSKESASKAIPEDFYSFVRSDHEQAPPASPALLDAAHHPPLLLLSLGAEDWPRWRQTKLSAEWLVGANFDPAVDAPQLTVTTPDGTTIATLSTAAPPGLVWLPPSAWQPGDRIKLTTLALSLPRVFAFEASGGDPNDLALYIRAGGEQLERVLPSAAQAADPGALLTPYMGPFDGSESWGTLLPNGQRLTLRGWLPRDGVPAGDTVNILLQWRLTGGASGEEISGAQEWPANLAAFIHLRHNSGIVAQADGLPQWFGRPAVPADMAGDAVYLNDWRQVTIPDTAERAGEWQIVVGAYDPQTSQRLRWQAAAGGNEADATMDEIVLGSVEVTAPAPPDQACALLPATCTSQVP